MWLPTGTGRMQIAMHIICPYVKEKALCMHLGAWHRDPIRDTTTPGEVWAVNSHCTKTLENDVTGIYSLYPDYWKKLKFSFYWNSTGIVISNLAGRTTYDLLFRRVMHTAVQRCMINVVRIVLCLSCTCLICITGRAGAIFWVFGSTRYRTEYYSLLITLWLTCIYTHQTTMHTVMLCIQ